MAKLFSNSVGRLIAIYDNAGLARWGTPVEAIYNLEFDELSNSELWEDLKRYYFEYKLVGSELTHNDIPIIINPPGEYYLAMQAIENGYPILPDWAKTGTAAQAETYINSQVWNGQTQAQVEAWIDANITNITTANVAQINLKLAAIRQGLKLAAGAIITMRGLFILTAKLLIYIRDLVIRFRKQ